MEAQCVKKLGRTKALKDEREDTAGRILHVTVSADAFDDEDVNNAVTLVKIDRREKKLPV